MVATTLSQSILAGMDPSTYRNISDIQNGEDYLKTGMDASPTSGWGAVGRLANALAGSYIQNKSISDLGKSIAAGKKSSMDDLMAALHPSSIPSAPPALAPGIPRSTPSTPGLQPDVPQAAVPVEPGSPNAQVAARFPANMSPGSGASPLPNNAPSPLDMAQYPVGPAGTPSDVAANNPLAGIAAATAPRGIRNNNALNIEDGPFAQSQPGYVGSDGRFAKFQTPEHGVAAASNLLDTYGQKHGLNTVAGIVGRWAPAGENNVSAYAADVAGKLGIDPNAPIPPAMKPQLIAAMAQHENGQVAPGTGPVQLASATPQTMTDASGGEAPAGQQVAQNTPDVHKLMAVMQNPYADEATKALASKLIIQQLTPKEDEFASSPQGIFNKRTGELAQGQGTAQFGGLQGPDLMAAVKQQNPALASQVQSVLDARAPYPTGSRLNPTQQQIKELVTQADPNFNAATWLARSNFQKNMASTVPNSFGGQIRSAGTVAKHLGDALDALPVLEKGTLGASNTLPVLNNVKGMIRNQTGDQDYQNAIGHYNTATKGLADEASNLLAGGHGAEGSKLYWQDRLDITKHSPAEVRGALDEFKSLMMGRVSNVAQEKDRVFGVPAEGATDPMSLFGPKEQENLKRIEGGTYGTQSAASPAVTAPASGPKTVSTKADYDELPSGSTYVAPDGSMRTKK